MKVKLWISKEDLYINHVVDKGIFINYDKFHIVEAKVSSFGDKLIVVLEFIEKKKEEEKGNG